MNKVILIGRLTRDPEVKVTQNQISVCSFNVAVDRRYKDANGEKSADFINCVAWRERADLIGKYFSKGSRIGIAGHLQTRTYEVEGVKRYVTEVIIDEIDFLESKRDKNSSEVSGVPTEELIPAAIPNNDFFPTLDNDTALPFDI